MYIAILHDQQEALHSLTMRVVLCMKFIYIKFMYSELNLFMKILMNNIKTSKSIWKVSEMYLFFRYFDQVSRYCQIQVSPNTGQIQDTLMYLTNVSIDTSDTGTKVRYPRPAINILKP